MKAFLMHRDRDFDLKRPLPPNADDLTQDLELDTLFGAMAQGDRYLFDIARRAILSSLTDPEEIVYRQHVLADCLAQPAVVRQIHGIAVEAIEGEKKIYRTLWESPDTVLARSIQVLDLFVDKLMRLRRIADQQAAAFRSDGFRRLFAMLERELDDAYFATVEAHLKELRFRRGVLISAELGKGLKGRDYVLRTARPQGWLERMGVPSADGYTFHIPDRDESGFKALAELRGRGINLVANALAQSTDHILSFFELLRAELAFYVGCLNLRERLGTLQAPTCVPVPVAAEAPAFAAHGLYDVCLALQMERRVVGNDVDADGRWLVMITGANQGGKSTFLRSVGLAQLMMQAGMFVAAESFRASIRAGVFTHFKREEDASMKSGKLDEELRRMSDIAEQLSPNGLVLFNESFAATNEREGSEIARQVVRALTERHITVFFVTHQYDLAHGFYRSGEIAALFLRAERQPDGGRTYRLSEGEPLPTSYGADSYQLVFGAAPTAEPMPTPLRAP